MRARLVLLHSPRAARLFASLAGGRRAEVRLAAISEAAAACGRRRLALRGGGRQPRATRPCWSLPQSCARLSAIERRATRMASPYDPGDDRAELAPRRRHARLSAAAGLFFLLGLAAMVWILTRWDAAAQLIGLGPEAARRPSCSTAAAARRRRSPRRARRSARAAFSSEAIVIDPELARRVAALEQRLGQVGSEARSASGNADRAEGPARRLRRAPRARSRRLFGLSRSLAASALRRQPAAARSA